MNRSISLLGTNFKEKHSVMDKYSINVIVPKLAEALGQNAKA